jgi:hypothetical protein
MSGIADGVAGAAAGCAAHAAAGAGAQVLLRHMPPPHADTSWHAVNVNDPAITVDAMILNMVLSNCLIQKGIAKRQDSRYRLPRLCGLVQRAPRECGGEENGIRSA